MAIRRILLVLVMILLAADAGACYWVSQYRDMLDVTEVRILVEKPDVADKVKTKLEASGHQVKEDLGVVQEREIAAGYKLTYAPSDVNNLVPILQTLKHDKIPLKLVDSKEIIYKIFPNEKAANGALAKVRSYGFQVAENTKRVTQKLCVLTVQVEGKNPVALIKDELKDFKEVRPDDVKVATPGGAAPGTPAASGSPAGSTSSVSASPAGSATPSAAP